MTLPTTDAQWLEFFRSVFLDQPQPERICGPARDEFDRPVGGDPTVPDRHGGNPSSGGQTGPSHLVASVAGEFADDIALIWPGDALAHYMLATDGQRQAWHCWLASPCGQVLRKFRLDFTSVRRRLATTRARDLLREAYGTCPPGLIQALGKCGTRARTRGFYPALVEALARQDLGAKHIRHSKTLSDGAVMSIAALPPDLQSKPLFATMLACSEDYFAQACWTLKRLADLGQPEAIARVLHSAEPMAALSGAIGMLPFPTPPWPGTGRLRPLTSVDALRAAGERLENCLTERACDYAADVVAGARYFYEWLGDDAAIVTLGSIRPLGWTVVEGHGRDNDPLDPATWAQIRAALSCWAELAPLWVKADGTVHGAGFFRAGLA